MIENKHGLVNCIEWEENGVQEVLNIFPLSLGLTRKDSLNTSSIIEEERFKTSCH